jgi:aspartate racemase
LIRKEVVQDDLLDREQIQGIILGGTELPLILNEATYHGVPMLDTSRIHARAIVAHAMA